MKLFLPQNADVIIRPCQYWDLSQVEPLLAETTLVTNHRWVAGRKPVWETDPLHRVLRFFQMLPNPFRPHSPLYVAQYKGTVCGAIQVNPFNRAGTTWRIEHLGVHGPVHGPVHGGSCGATESQSALTTALQLLRYCATEIWQARAWIAEVNIQDRFCLSVYRQSGFQPLAQLTYWAIAPDVLQTLSEGDPSLPNLCPVRSMDASLLCQLDTAALPPLVRQVFDRRTPDFSGNLWAQLAQVISFGQRGVETVQAYITDPQRKVAIGTYEAQFCRDGSQPHWVNLTTHPGYSWLYENLVGHLAQLVRAYPPQALQLTSADYQPDREVYLERIGAKRIEQTVLMSRSVWHKLRDPRVVSLESLSLAGMLPRLQPGQETIPGRVSLPVGVAMLSVAERSNQQTCARRPESHSPSSSPLFPLKAAQRVGETGIREEET